MNLSSRMVFDIAQLKKIRRNLGLTQHQLAQKIGISQSMIAKIEAGKLDPTYSYVQKIEKGIETLVSHETRKAKDLMHQGLITVGPRERIERVLKLMIKKDISQVPVVEGKEVVGLVTESDLLELSEEEVHSRSVKEIMREAPPVFPADAEQSAIISVLKFYPLVVVKEKGVFVGVVTKIDVLKRME